MDKFLLADNPMTESDETYIVHALPPFSLIQAFQGAGKANIAPELFQSFAFRNSIGEVEDWTLAILYSEAPVDQAGKLLSKAWRWYRAYMEWEDKQFDNE
ncbi:hypothetical protein [Flavihumibacter petaseus]|uniref:Uncharacterized protein n=1 Tax=Flavihumibacter petaseus NBRC 106054 TaxID=1220578 RepID=A0A0E9N1T9_9BACT|nr:hypothetical protein [Flavihumibacter petaseus]GAO43819.1 hypothetical protein FPE01S_02_09250 [Flavihumibacter petaseus NBRC 106054]